MPDINIISIKWYFKLTVNFLTCILIVSSYKFTSFKLPSKNINNPNFNFKLYSKRLDTNKTSLKSKLLLSRRNKKPTEPNNRIDEVLIEINSAETVIKEPEELDELDALIEEGGKYLNLNNPSINFDSKKYKEDDNNNREKYNNIMRDKGNSETMIQELILRRSNARKSLDYISADSIKMKLEDDFGVEIFDSLGIWKSSSGLCGSLTPESELNTIPCSLTFEKAQELVNNRTKARRNRDFKLADEIRVELTLGGVGLDDRKNMWRSYDGTLSGSQSSDFQEYTRNKN